MKTNYSVNSVPSAYITKNKQRVRQYGTTNYLKNGDEFEIELYNPLQKTILAKISLNGIDISSTGLILKPGQRIFLERYFDKPNKFKFETYEVEDSDESKAAIALNGDLEVKFYLETEPLYYQNDTIYYPHWTPPITYPTYEPTVFWYGCGGTTTSNHLMSTSNVGNINYISNAISASNSTRSIETGRVESGSYSNQSFKTENRQFDNYPTYSSYWKILPESQKPFDSKDLKNYCPNCGTRIKKSSHKFCYNCGNPLN